jgi:alpha-L-fucosidase 2
MVFYHSVIAALASFIGLAASASEASHKLRYSAPAARDFFDGLPIGNGRIGAVVHGYIDKELIRLNEESIWSGGPMDKVPPTAKDNLQQLREQILNGSLTEAGETWSQHFVPEHDDMRRYQPAGELRLDFPHAVDEASSYKRELDISNGIASVSYKIGDVTYTREIFGNYPHNVLAVKLSTDQPASLNLSLALSRDLNATVVEATTSPSVLTLHGTGTEDDTYRFASKALVILSIGT